MRCSPHSFLPQSCSLPIHSKQNSRRNSHASLSPIGLPSACLHWLSSKSEIHFSIFIVILLCCLMKNTTQPLCLLFHTIHFLLSAQVIILQMEIKLCSHLYLKMSCFSLMSGKFQLCILALSGLLSHPIPLPPCSLWLLSMPSTHPNPSRTRCTLTILALKKLRQGVIKPR